MLMLLVALALCYSYTECMKKQWVIGVSFLLVLGLSVAYLALSNSPTTNPNSQNNQASDTTQPTNNPPSASGEYVDYSDGVIANTPGAKILFFHAPWCPQCRALEADITDNGVPEGVTVIKVDYDSSQELRQQYGVTLQTTTVLVDDNGQEINKFVAYDSPTINAVIAALKP